MASSVGRAAAISHRHKLAGHVPPTRPGRRRPVLRGIRKQDRSGRAGAEIAIPRGYRLRPVEAVQTYAGQFL
jgi:hypothetical protein